MFNKEKKSAIAAEPFKSHDTPVQPPASILTEEHSQGNTVVAKGVKFEGSISATGTVYIHGEVHGNVESESGIIKIMRSGLVEGNVAGKEVIIDGTVNGQCHADVIDIHENGKVTGEIVYHSLAVKRGGVFIGKADIRPAAVNNVIEMSTTENDDEHTALQDVLSY